GGTTSSGGTPGSMGTGSMGSDGTQASNT
ncbi:hypothetical protein NPIL_122791, partial [Nephila pilipes]